MEAYRSPGAVYDMALGSEVKSLKVEYEQEVAARQCEFAKKRKDAGTGSVFDPGSLLVGHVIAIEPPTGS